MEKQNECKKELLLRKIRQKLIWFAKSGLESRSGQGFSRAVATAITASGMKMKKDVMTFSLECRYVFFLQMQIDAFIF